MCSFLRNPQFELNEEPDMFYAAFLRSGTNNPLTDSRYKMAKLEIKQIRSAIGRQQDQKKTLVALGITKMGRTIVHEDTPQILGMINKISHLLEVKEV